MKTLFLLLLLVSTPGIGQPEVAVPSLKTEETIMPDPKAQLLCRAARWQWRMKKPGQVVPVFDSLDIEDFRKSAFKADRTEKPTAGIGVLFDSVSARLKVRKLTYNKATPAEVGFAIGAVLQQQYRGTPEAAQAAAFVKLLAPPTMPGTTQLVPQDTPAAAQVPQPLAPASPAGGVAVKAPTPWIPLMGGFALGLVLGVIGCWFWLSQKLKNERVHIREAMEREYKIVIQQADGEIQRLRNMTSESARSAQPLRPTNTVRNTPAPAAPIAPAAPVTPVPPVAPEPPTIAEVAAWGLADAPAEPERTVELNLTPTPARFYAPAPDVPYIEHRKLSAESFDIMPVRLLIADGPDGTSATYGFSPEADQQRIIADGVRNLRAFFDFELPPTERFSRIETVAPGRLERVGERWEVREKAQLHIS
jgi:hypothetical protein